MLQTRNTQQRQLVLDMMKENFTHPTADEIYTKIRRKAPKISRGTVYRNLNLLSEQGMIQRLTTPAGPDHYDCNTNGHYHFLCRKCDRVFDASIPYDEALDRTPASMAGFKTEYHWLMLVGLCPDCQKEKEK